MLVKTILKLQSVIKKLESVVKELLKNYSFINTTEFGCIQKFSYEGKEYSCRYLEMANRIDNIKKLIDFSKIKTYFEIGGGFGANIHFLLGVLRKSSISPKPGKTEKWKNIPKPKNQKWL